MRFVPNDFERVLDFVRDLYSHHALDDFSDRTMVSLRDIIGAERIVYGNFDVERQAASLRMQPPIVTEPDGTVDGAVNGALNGLESNFGAHPLFRYYLQSGDGQAQRLSQIMTRSQFRRHCAVDDFVRQLGAKYQMGMFFAPDPAAVTAVLLIRTRRDFSERERALLSTLHPHLVQSFRNVASLNRYCRDLDELVSMLEGPISSVIVLAGDGCVKRWTEQAKSWINRYCRTPFPAEQNRLPQCFADWYQDQLAKVAREQPSAAPRNPLLVEKNGRQLIVQLIPDHLRDEHLLLLNERRRDSSWNSLAEHGLTPRESEVLAWVAKGKTNAEVGAILQMSSRTVQKHLEHVYQKLGVETRTTATVRVLRMLGIEDR